MPEPLALELLAATLEKDHDVRILDMRLDGDLAAALNSFSPDLVAVTALTTEVYAAHEVLRAVKRFDPKIFTVMGGHHASLVPEDFFLPEVDAIALGEGELVFPPLVRAIEAGTPLAGVPNLIRRDGDGRFITGRRRSTALVMDELPLPRRDLTRAYRPEYFFLFDKPDTSVATGRGCPYQCNFCSVWTFYKGKTRQMTPARVIEEIKAVETDHMTFVDDNFLLNVKRENAIADLIKSEGIRKRFSMECRTDSIVRHPELVSKWVGVGLYAVLLGLEGASDTALKNVNKKNTSKNNDEAIRILKDHGVIIWGAFLVDPQWTADDFQALRDYVAAKEITHTQFTVLTPLPGTDLFRQRFDELLTYDYACYDALHAVTPTRMDRVEFYKNFANLYRQTNLGPYYELVSEGKLTIDDCKRGKAMLDAMTDWEKYLDKDPVLGNCRPKSEALPGILKLGRRSRAVGA
ncbi:MAG: radical SAM protein [Phycisphaerae bacterium]